MKIRTENANSRAPGKGDIVSIHLANENIVGKAGCLLSVENKNISALAAAKIFQQAVWHMAS